MTSSSMGSYTITTYDGVADEAANYLRWVRSMLPTEHEQESGERCVSCDGCFYDLMALLESLDRKIAYFDGLVHQTVAIDGSFVVEFEVADAAYGTN